MAGVKHSSSADGSFSGTGATNWNADHVITGDIDMGGFGLTNTNIADTKIPFADSSKKLVTGNLSFASDRMTIGTGSGTTQGWVIGQASNNIAGMWSTALEGTLNSANSALCQDNSGNTSLNAKTGCIVTIGINGAAVITQSSTAGAGPAIVAGTAVAAGVAAHSITRTNNHANVDTGVKWTFTDTTSAAGFKPFQILGGAAGATNLLSVSKAGLIDAPAYSAAGSAGVDFNGAVTNITVVKGIVTAAS